MPAFRETEVTPVQQLPMSPSDPATPHPHDFEAQKRIHRRIRNDPDYDDWDYGTEPLPHEAWLKRDQDKKASGEPGPGDPPGSAPAVQSPDSSKR